MRIALDTNVLASAIGTRGLCADVLRAVLLEHELVIGEQVLLELRRTLEKKFRLPSAVIAEFEALLRSQGQVGSAATAPAIAGVDQDDAQVLADAIASNAELFVTGDGRLQVLGDRAPVPILSPRQLWEFLRSGGTGAP